MCVRACVCVRVYHLIIFTCFGVVSRSVIIGTGVAGSLLVGAVLLLLTIVGCIKIIKSRIPKKKE